MAEGQSNDLTPGASSSGSEPLRPSALGLRPDKASPLPSMSLLERVRADYDGTGLTIGPHPMALARSSLATRGVRLRVIGRRDRLPPALVAAIGRAEQATAGGRILDLRIAIDYSAREAIVRAAGRLSPGEQGGAAFARRLAEACATDAMPDVDLVIRTGGERRLSDFLLWESAYAELYFMLRAWPDFGRDDLAAALADYRGRERRFGGLVTGGRA